MGTQIRDFDFVRSSSTKTHNHAEVVGGGESKTQAKIKNKKSIMDPYTMRRRLDELKSVSEPETYLEIKKQPSQKFFNKSPKFKFKKAAQLLATCACVVVAGYSLLSFSDTPIRPGQVAGIIGEGVSESAEDEHADQFKLWIEASAGEFSDQDADFDNDGLSNFEEFLLQSQPDNAHQCDPNKLDGQLVSEAIDPTTCEEVDWNDQYTASIFEQLITDPERYAQITSVDGVDPVQSNSSVDNISGEVNTDRGDIDSINESIEQLKKQAETLDLVERIDAYIARSRSYEPYDRNYEVPVSSEIFIQTSEQYDVPLKYVLTIAKLESRFGTDRFDQNGNLTRPGQYQNMYSLGLDDSGNNVNYGGWDAGVLAFGKWYKKFEDAGVSDCRKWRIYNPNGDYCAKVEAVSRQIEASIGL